MLGLVLFITAAFLLLTLLHIYCNHTRTGKLFHKVPMPKWYPIIGHVFLFALPEERIFSVIDYLKTKWYPTTGIFYWTNRDVIIRHPDDIEILLSSTKHIVKGRIYEYLRPWLGKGLVPSTGENWRQHRRIISAAFHVSLLKKYCEIYCEQGDLMIKDLKARGEESIQNVEIFSQYTLAVICGAAMGIDARDLDVKTFNDIKCAIEDISRVVRNRIVKPYIPDWLMNYIKLGKVQKKAISTLNEISSKIITAREEYHKSTNYRELDVCSQIESNDMEIYVQRQKKRMCILDMLLSAKRDGLIDYAGILDEVNNFMFAGQDTSTITMGYTVMLFAHNQEHQDRARTEVNEVLKQNNSQFSWAALQQLGYLERCIKESLRLYPPVPITSRSLQEDLQLTKYLIPESIDINVLSYDTHRDAEFWPDPEKFDPDRFLPENMIDRHPFSYVPFSAGPRNCIGQKFATLELKAFLGRILHNFRLEPVTKLSEIRLTPNIMLRPVDPINVKFIRINNPDQS